MKHYPVARPYITAEDKKSVLAVLNTDNLSLGPKYREFEKKFARKIGVKYCPRNPFFKSEFLFDF